MRKEVNPCVVLIELFGALSAWPADAPPVEFDPRRTGTVLAWLALHLDTPQTRAEMCALFWPDDEPDAARYKLRQALYAIRGKLEQPAHAPDPLLLATGTTVQLNPALVRTDVAAFEEAHRAGKSAVDPAEQIRFLSEGVRLYRGDLLPGFYQDWVLAERRRLEEVYRDVLRRLIRAYEQCGDLEHALETAHRLVALDPLVEEAH